MINLYRQIVILIVLAVLSGSVLAERYDPLLLRAQASIFPKIILLDQDLETKITGNEVVITIISTTHELNTANKLKMLILDKYGGGLGGYKLSVNTVFFDDVDKSELAAAYIVLQGPELLIEKVVSHASSHKRIVFSYSYADFIYNTTISLYVREKTYIYFNKPAINLYGINFLPVFYKITKIIE